MRKLFLLLLSIAASAVTYSQETGTAQYKIRLFEDTFTFDATLVFSRNLSQFNYKANSDEKWVLDNNVSGFQIVYTDETGYNVTSNLLNGALVVREFCRLKEPILYQDTVKFNWTLGSENKLIGDINCRNAFTNFRGRKYEAWYAVEIPISAGPWKFHGLPGLIIQVKDKKEKVSMSLVSYKPSPEPIFIPFKKDGFSITRQEALQCLDESYVEMYAKNKTIITQLQAEFPDIEITDNNLSPVRLGTELKEK